MKATIPIIKSGAVSPSAPAMPMIVPVRMPGMASGKDVMNRDLQSARPRSP